MAHEGSSGSRRAVRRLAAIAIVGVAATLGYWLATRPHGAHRRARDVPEAPAGPQASFVGEVRDDAGTPIAGATVEALLFVDPVVLRPGEARTDAHGHFRLAEVPTGRYALLVGATDHARAEVRTEAHEGENRLAPIALADAAPVRGLVAGEDGARIRGATVLAWPEGEGLPQVATSGADGTFSLDGLSAGRYRIEVRARGRSPRVRTNVVAPGTIGEIRLGAAGSLSVRVVDRESKAVEGAEVVVGGSGLWPPRTLTSDADGHADLPEVAEGVYEVRASKGALVSEPSLGLEIRSGQAASVTLVLLPGARVTGRVVDAVSEHPIAGAKLVLAEDALAVIPRHATSDAEGRFAFDALLPRPHRLSARADGRVPVLGIPVTPGVPVTVELVQGGTVRGHVVDERGFPVAGAAIEASGTDASGGALLVSAGTRALADAHFLAVTGGLPGPGVPGVLLPAGELGVVPGPLPPPPTALGTPLVSAPGGSFSLLVDPALASGARGEFVLEGVPPGRLVVSASHPDHARGHSKTIALEPGGDVRDVEVVLPAGATLDGRVVDDRGFPLPGAEVKVRGADDPAPRLAYSDADGAFTMTGLPAVVQVDVSLPPRTPLSVRVDLEPGQAAERSFALEPPAPAWRARVEDGHGFPIEGAMVEASTVGAGARQRGFDVTDDEGAFELDGLGGRAVRLSVAHPSYATKRIDRMDATDDARIVLDPPAGLAVTVTDDSTGDPIGGYSVEARPPVGPPSRAVGGADGKTDITNLPPGRYAVVVRAAGFAEKRADVDLPAPRGLERTTADLEVSLVAGATIRGEVVDGRGDPVSGARVSPGRGASMTRGQAAPPGATDVRGRFVLPDLGPGDVHLVATHPTLGEATVDVRVRAGDEIDDVRIRFEGRLGDTEEIPEPTASGVAIELEPQRPVVRAVVGGSAAEDAGIEVGDVVVRIDGRAVRTAADATRALAGADGTEAEVTLRREGETFDVVVRRETLRR